MFSIPVEANKSAEKTLKISDEGVSTSVLYLQPPLPPPPPLDFLLFAFQIYYFNMACDLEKGRIKYPEKSWCLIDFWLNPEGNYSVFYGIFCGHSFLIFEWNWNIFKDTELTPLGPILISVSVIKQWILI